MAGKFEIYKDKAGDFRFRLKASNGQTVLTSEGYRSRASVENGVRAVQENCRDPRRFEKSMAPSGAPRFRLTGRNREVIGQSESYRSTAARDKGIQAVIRAAKGAKVVEAMQ